MCAASHWVTTNRAGAARINNKVEELIASQGSQLWLEPALALAMADPAVQAEHTQCEGRPCLAEYAGGMFVMLAPRANGRLARTAKPPLPWISGLAPTA